MKCPRCDNEWNARVGACTNCGLTVRGISPLRSGSHGSSTISVGREQRPDVVDENKDIGQWIGWRPKGFSMQPPSAVSQTPFNGSESTTGSLPHRKFQPLPSTPAPMSAPPSAVLPSPPGTILRGGHYRLGELRESQEWSRGVLEATWASYDVQQSPKPVMICELVLPQMTSAPILSTLQQAALALKAIAGHRRIPSIQDVFSEQGRAFFVFEACTGESLLDHMRASGGVIAEQYIIDCCLQMTEVLELLRQQFPPLVHGNIRPEHILLTGDGWQCILTNISVVLAMQTPQLIAAVERTRLSPYMAPELTRGVIDSRSDLYSLMATAYHAVTGNMPTGGGQPVRPARQVNADVSPQFEAILTKGLQPLAEHRYQRVSELRHDLLTTRATGRSNINLAPPLPFPMASTQKKKDQNDL